MTESSSNACSSEQVFSADGVCLDWQIDRALGACIGACIGDAAGAPLEKLGREATSSELKSALALNGGGSLQTAAGQVTDDGELTVSLARGLHACVSNGTFDLDLIADKYADWARSEPFDMGITIGSSIGTTISNQPNFVAFRQQFGNALAMQRGAAFEAKLAAPSQSNGQLMRASPLAAYCWRLPPDSIAQVCRLDASLSHIAPECADVCTAYCIAASRLVADASTTGAEAFAAAAHWVRTNACARVQAWLVDIDNGVPLAAYPHAGFVKIAFSFAMFHLKHETPFNVALEDTLRRGGDTDTNAAIVCGLLGALHGFNALPTELKARVASCRYSHKPRPPFLHPATLLELVPDIVRRAPEKFEQTKRFPMPPVEEN